MMVGLKESIISSTNSGKIEVMKGIAKKIAQFTKKFNGFTKKSTGEYFDSFGQKVELGDIVLNSGSFSTNMIEPLVVLRFDIERDIPDAIMCWDPYKEKERRTTLAAVVKLNDPSKIV